MKRIGTGFCKFCGQAFAIESDKELTEEQLNKEATWKCNCEEAIHARNVEEYKKTANTSIDVLFGTEEFAEVEAVEFLKSAVPLLAERKILSMTVDLDGRFKAKLTSTVAGKVKVTKTLSENGRQKIEKYITERQRLLFHMPSDNRHEVYPYGS